MERKILQFLRKWKNDSSGKPLMLYGSKQVGKTFSVLSFGEKEYKNVVYFNTENNVELDDLFRREKAIEKIIVNLSLLSGETILKKDTLIVLDNLVNNDIVKGIKLFGSDKSEYNIIAITSRREKLSEFKGEELQFKNMTENIKSIRPHAVAVGGIFSAVVNAVKHPLIGLLLLPLAVFFPNIAANLYYTEFSKQNYATLKKFREIFSSPRKFI